MEFFMTACLLLLITPQLIMTYFVLISLSLLVSSCLSSPLALPVATSILSQDSSMMPLLDGAEDL